MQSHKKILGFSLIEVLVALCILAIAVTSLVIIRNNAIHQAAQSVELRKFRMLLEEQMGKIAIGLEKGTSGSFEDKEYENYRWEAEIKKIPVQARGIDGKLYEVILKKVSLKIKNIASGKYSKEIVGYFFIEKPEHAPQETDDK